MPMLFFSFSYKYWACCNKRHLEYAEKKVFRSIEETKMPFRMPMLFFPFSYKYWTCCNKRTSDFQEFLKQGGCDSGKHEWMKPSEVRFRI